MSSVSPGKRSQGPFSQNGLFASKWAECLLTLLVMFAGRWTPVDRSGGGSERIDVAAKRPGIEAWGFSPRNGAVPCRARCRRAGNHPPSLEASDPCAFAAPLQGAQEGGTPTPRAEARGSSPPLLRSGPRIAGIVMS